MPNLTCAVIALLLVTVSACPLAAQGGALAQGPEGAERRFRDPLLEWIALHQKPDGRWTSFGPSTPAAVPKASQPELSLGKDRDLGVTGLTILSLLGSGTTYRMGEGRAVVLRGLKWMKGQASPGGLISTGKHQNILSDHAIATLVMCEVSRLTESDLFKSVASKAVAWLLSHMPLASVTRGVKALSVEEAAYAYCALHSASRLGFAVDQTKVKLLLESVDTDSKSSFRVLCVAAMMRSLSGETTLRSPSLAALLDRMMAHKDAAAMSDPLATYFGSIAANRAGGKHWKHWKEQLQKPVVKPNEPPLAKGAPWPSAGSFFGGHVGTVALRQLVIELYYQYPSVFGAVR